MPLRSRILTSLILLLVLALSLSCNPNPQPEALTPIPTLAPAATLTLVTELQEPPPTGGEASGTSGDEASTSPAPEGGDPAQGAVIFADNCAGCHGESAEGGAVGPTLVSAEATAKDDDYYRQTIADGVEGTAMPSWTGILSDQEIEDVIAYLRSLQ